MRINLGNCQEENLMKKKRILSLIIGISMLANTLSACNTSSTGEASEQTPSSNSGQNSSSESSMQQSESDKVDTITVWSNDAHNKKEYEAKIHDFNETIGKEKGIIIEYTVYGGDYYNTLDVAIQADEAPHIFKCNKIGQYASSGDILALEDLPTGPELVAKYESNNAENYGEFGGKTYSVPFRVVTFGLAYNMDMFEEMGLTPPETWDEMRDVAAKITQNGNGQIYGYAFPMAYTSYRYQYVIHPSAASCGIEFFDHKTGKYNFSSLEPFFNHLLDIINDGSMFPGYMTMDDDTKRAQFSAGNVGMICIGSSDVGVFQDQFPCDFEWGIIPYPVQNANERYKYPVSPSMFYVINSKTERDGLQEKAMEVYNMFLSNDMLVTTYENEKDNPVLGEEITSQSQKTDISSQWKAFCDMSLYCIRYPYPENDVVVEGDAYNAIFDQILCQTINAHDALAELDTRYNAALEEAIANGLNIEDYIDPDYDQRMAWEK